jgi:hypothetical protein
MKTAAFGYQCKNWHSATAAAPVSASVNVARTSVFMCGPPRAESRYPPDAFRASSPAVMRLLRG